MKKVFLIFIALFLNFFISYGQLQENYFYNIDHAEGGQIKKCLKDGNNIYVGGNFLVGISFKPAIIKLDTNGTEIWTASNTIYYTSDPTYVDQMFISNGFIYAVCHTNAACQTREVWKVNASTGAVVWTKQINANMLGGSVDRLADLDANRLILAYAWDHPSLYRIKITILEKTNGNIVYSRLITNNGGEQFGVGADSNHNIYYASLDTLAKLYAGNYDSAIFKSHLHHFSGGRKFKQIYIDENDSIFLFGDLNGPFVSKVTSDSGKIIWEHPASAFSSPDYNDMLDKNDHLYVSWIQTLCGSIDNYFSLSKVDKTGGTIDWNVNYHFNGVGGPLFSGGDGIKSFDVDNQGDAFATGYYGSSNYGPSNWGIIKINGADGSVAYERTITNDSLDSDQCQGMGAFIINNKPFFVGDLETRSGVPQATKSTFVKFNGANGTISSRKYFGDLFTYPSSTVEMLRYCGTQTLLLKQVGRFALLEKYDLFNNLVWSKLFSNKVLFAKNLLVLSNGNIVLSGCSKDETNSPPYYNSITDSVHVYWIDPSGNQIGHCGFYAGSSDVYPVELTSTPAGHTFLFYNRSSSLYYRKITPGSIAAETNLNLDYTSQISNSRFTSVYNNSCIGVFGLKNSLVRLKEINAVTGTFTDVDTIPVMTKVNYVGKENSGNILLGGLRADSRDIMISYSPVSHDTLWTASYEPSSEILKFDFDSDTNYVYTAGIKSTDIVVRKISVLNGHQVWSHLYSGGGSLESYPSDITVDNFSSSVLFTGYSQVNVMGTINKNIYYEEIDTTGGNVNSFLKAGQTNGTNMGTDLLVLCNSNVWLGGYRCMTNYGVQGFLYKIDTTVILTPVSQGTSNPDYSLHIFPNPSDGNFYFQISEPGLLEIFNITGHLLYSEPLAEGLYNSTLQLPKGMYLIKVTGRKSSQTGKLLIIE